MTPITMQETICLPTGTLSLTVDHGPNLHDLCDFAARANPKRGFLVVSKILGRHLPASPQAMRASMHDLANRLPADIQQPVVFLGMAETATALGQGIFAAFRALRPDVDAVYLQTTRQKVEGAILLAAFEEGHSHATTHRVQIANSELATKARSARTLVIVDDECSTGKTYVAAANALAAAMHALEAVETCCITDWSGGGYLGDMPLTARSHAILHGTMHWEAGAMVGQTQLAPTTNKAGTAPIAGMRSRTGLYDAEAAQRSPLSVRTGERVLVLGDGEHSYEALLVAEEVERQGGIAAVQCITRTPALIGSAMQNVSRFSDAYGSGAPCFLYNILAHAPDRIVIVSEVEGEQLAEAQLALAKLGTDLPVETLLCHYPADGVAA